MAQPAQCVLSDVTLDPSQTEPPLELERAHAIPPRHVRGRSGHGAHVSPVERLQLRNKAQERFCFMVKMRLNEIR